MDNPEKPTTGTQDENRKKPQHNTENDEKIRHHKTPELNMFFDALIVIVTPELNMFVGALIAIVTPE